MNFDAHINDLVTWISWGVMSHTVSWRGAVTSWSLVITIRLPGKRRLKKMTATAQEIVLQVTPRITTNCNFFTLQFL